VTDVAEDTLKKNELTFKSILPKNIVLQSKNKLNMSDGGRYKEYLEK